MTCEDAAHQLLGDLGEDRGRRNRRRQRDGARDRAQVGEPHAHRHGPAGPRFRPEPGADPVGEDGAAWAEDALLGRLAAERRLGAGRTRPAMRLDLPWIAIPRQRRQLVAQRAAEQPLQRSPRGLRQLPDGVHADLGEPRLGDGADAPHQLDRQVVEERELGRGIDDDEPVGLGRLRGDLRQVLGARHADRDRQSELRPHAAADRPWRSRPAGRRGASSRPRRQRPRRWRCAPPAA